MYVYMHGVLQCVAVCCSVLQCVAVFCSVLQCVAVCVVKREAKIHVRYMYVYIYIFIYVHICIYAYAEGKSDRSAMPSGDETNVGTLF